MDGYTAYGSFAPIYTNAARRLMDDRDRVSFHVLYALAQHADGYGICYPGPKRLETLVGYVEASCVSALNRLIGLDYVRVHRHLLRSRGTEVLDYQISPHVLYIRPENIDHAHELWSEAIVIRVATKGKQPDFQPDAVNQLYNQQQQTSYSNQNHHHHHHTSDETSGAGASGGTPRDQRNGRSNMSRSDADPAANSRTEYRLLPISQFRTALPDATAEQFAALCKLELATRLRQARQLVATYGIPRVDAALAYLRDERRAGARVASAYGLVLWWLSQQVDDEYDHSDEAAAFERHTRYAGADT